MTKITVAKGMPSYVILYDTPEGNEEYYAYFSDEKQALEFYNTAFDNKPGYKLVAVAKVVAYSVGD